MLAHHPLEGTVSSEETSVILCCSWAVEAILVYYNNITNYNHYHKKTLDNAFSYSKNNYQDLVEPVIAIGLPLFADF